MSPRFVRRLACWFVGLECAAVAVCAEEPKPIEIAAVKHDGPVSYAKEIRPILVKSCLACHNAKTKESGLVLENVPAMLKGGDSGPAIVARQSGESLLLKVASHADEPTMPPDNNKAGAPNLTPQELGLLRLWIDEGAVADAAAADAPLKWQPLPPGVNPIYSVAISPDGQLAAAGRANQVFVYHAASGQLLTKLSDPELQRAGVYQRPGVAHLDLVQSLAFSPDGQWLASGAFREVKLWQRPRDVRRLELAGLAAPAASVAVEPGGNRAALGHADGTISLWDLASGKQTASLTGHGGAVAAVRFVPGGQRLVSGSSDKTLRVWNLADGKPLWKLDTPTAIAALALVADGTQVATGGGDPLIRVWSLPANLPPADPGPGSAPPAPQKQLSGHSQPVTALEASPTDKAQLYSASGDGSLRRWNLQNGQQAQQWDHGAAVTALAVRPDAQQLATAGANNLIRLWNAQNGQPWQGPAGQRPAEMKGDQRAQLLVAQLERAASRGTARVVDVKKALADAEQRVKTTADEQNKANAAKETAAKTLGEKTTAAKAPLDAKVAADKEAADSAAALKTATDAAAAAKAAAEKEPNNQDLAKANELARKGLDEATGKARAAEQKAKDAAGPAAKAMQELTTAEAAKMAADEAATAAANASQKAQAALPAAQELVRATEAALAKTRADAAAAQHASAAQEKPVRALAYSADGAQLASGGDNQMVRVWSSATGAPIESYAGHAAPIAALAFLTDGGLLSLSADKGAIVWQTQADWKLVRALGHVEHPETFVDRVLALAFSPDGAVLAAGGGEPSRSGELKLFNVADGQLIRALPEAHSDTIFGLEFSPDGAHLASCGADRFMKVFAVGDGKLVKAFEGHTHHVLDVSWRADGKLLATAGADNVFKIWDFATGEQKLTSQPLGKEMTSLAFLADQPRLVVSSGDKTVRLFNADNGNAERNYGGGGDFMYSAAASPDGRIVIGGGQDSVLRIWNAENAQVIHTLGPPQAAGDRAKE